jgi:hypothetical protein
MPELALWTAEVAAAPGPSPASVVRRLAELGSRPSVAEAEGARRESTPWAYRVLARQLGAERPAAEPADLTSRGLPADALAIASAQTGVPLLAFDAARLDGALALRRARAGERLGAGDPELAEGQVVMADHARPVAVVLGQSATETAASADTERVLLAAVQAKGVPTLAVEEALWTAIEVLRERI